MRGELGRRRGFVGETWFPLRDGVAGMDAGYGGNVSESVEEQRTPEEPDEQAAESVLPAEPPAKEQEPAREPWPGESETEHAPGELEIPAGYGFVEGHAEGAARRSVGVVVARFNGEITQRLLDTALAELDGLGVLRANVSVMPVPGAFELPLGAMALAKTRRYACIVALGCVIRGDTPHFDYVAGEAASGLQLAALETGVPVAFGLLTCDTREQAEARVEKGAEAVRTALEMAHLFTQLRTAAG
jgi:6,7-dimethyl-8-ribityllumazine synthase